MNSNLELYRKYRDKNSTINWLDYIKLSPDLHIIKNYDKSIEHWINYGIKEGRKYSEDNIELKNIWSSIFHYLIDNNYKHSSFAFIITTCVKEQKHLDYLKKCIESIRSIYSDKYIYIINDNSNEKYDLEKELKEYNDVELISSIVNRGGEINPYLFILDSRCKYDKLVYLHDSTFLKEKIDRYIESTEEILFFWKCDTAIFNDTNNKIENKEIFENFYLYFSNSKINLNDYFKIIKKYKHFDVKFGAMSIFTKRFMEKIDLVTNFTECSKYFKNRINRCFLERLLTILYIFIYNKEYSINKYICGDINNHPFPFMNNNPDIEIITKIGKELKKIQYGPLVKVWQGR